MSPIRKNPAISNEHANNRILQQVELDSERVNQNYAYNVEQHKLVTERMHEQRNHVHNLFHHQMHLMSSHHQTMQQHQKQRTKKQKTVLQDPVSVDCFSGPQVE